MRMFEKVWPLWVHIDIVTGPGPLKRLLPGHLG